MGAPGKRRLRLAVLAAASRRLPRRDAERYAFDTTLFSRLPTQSGRSQAVASLFGGGEDSDVAFHDSELTMVNLGVMYRFGAR